jgi:YgiT-type zinc finger domain-containing protein
MRSGDEMMSVEPMLFAIGQRADQSGARCGCPRCGGGPVEERTISSVFWRGEAAIMIRDVPAMICTHCGEDFISDATARELDRIRNTGFAGGASDDQICMSVFKF